MIEHRDYTRSAVLACSASFWAKVDKDGECWLWTSAVRGRGYGVFHARLPGGRWRCIGAHRAAWVLCRGVLPDESISVCHRCDNPSCVNPAHLFLGTNIDNIRDRDAKGRQARGERQSKAKLTEERVVALRLARAAGVMTRDLAREFGISQWNVCFICQGRGWKHVGGPLTFGRVA